MLQQFVVAVEVQPRPVVFLPTAAVLQEMVHLLELAVAADGDKLDVLAPGIDAVAEVRHGLYLGQAVGVAHSDKGHIHPFPFQTSQRHLFLVHVGQGEVWSLGSLFLLAERLHQPLCQNLVFREFGAVANQVYHLHHFVALIVTGLIVGFLQRLERHQLAHLLVAQQCVGAQ